MAAVAVALAVAVAVAVAVAMAVALALAVAVAKAVAVALALALAVALAVAAKRQDYDQRDGGRFVAGLRLGIGFGMADELGEELKNDAETVIEKRLRSTEGALDAYAKRCELLERAIGHLRMYVDLPPTDYRSREVEEAWELFLTIKPQDK